MRYASRTSCCGAGPGGFLALVLALFVLGCEEAPAGPDSASEDIEILAAMEVAIQDEYKAELVYLQVMEDFGSVPPFSNIVFAEERHSEALARLFQARGVDVPESKWDPSQIPSFSSLSEACRAGVTAEIENAEIYQGYLDLDLPADVRQVFESNQAASLERHLPAFERCS
ncbi:MAG: DUF2202 domain-containing protein [Gemmatimonadota bacterium]